MNALDYTIDAYHIQLENLQYAYEEQADEDIAELTTELDRQYDAYNALASIVAALDRRLQRGNEYMPTWFLLQTADCPVCGQPARAHVGEIHCDDDHGCMLEAGA